MRHDDKDKTPWFPGTVKPVRPGVYEVGHDPRTAPHHRSRFYLTGHRRYFDGKTWRAGWLDELVSIFGTHPSHQWRGLRAQSDSQPPAPPTNQP